MQPLESRIPRAVAYLASIVSVRGGVSAFGAAARNRHAHGESVAFRPRGRHYMCSCILPPAVGVAIANIIANILEGVRRE